MGLFDGAAQRRQQRLAKELRARLLGAAPYLKAGRFAEIEPNLREYLAQAETELGESHTVTLAFRNQLAQLWNHTMRHEEAERETLRVLALSRSASLDSVLLARQQYASALNGQGRHEEAARACAELAELAQGSPKLAAQMTAWAQLHRIVALNWLERFQEAELECGRALRRAGALPEPQGTPILIKVMGAWATALLGSGRAASAETAAKKGAMFADRTGVGPVDKARHYVELFALVARAQAAQGRAQEAMDLLARTDGIPEQLRAGQLPAARAEALLAQGRPQEAVPLARLALDEALRVHPERHGAVLRIRALLDKAEHEAGLS